MAENPADTQKMKITVTKNGPCIVTGGIPLHDQPVYEVRTDDSNVLVKV